MALKTSGADVIRSRTVESARDPLWALTCVVFSPIRGGLYLAKSLLMALIVAIILLFAVSFAELDPDSLDIAEDAAALADALVYA